MNTELDKVIIISGDGDYFNLVNFLIEQNRFEKILFPNKRFASSLYKRLTARYYDYLENIRGYIELRKSSPNEKGT